MSYSQCGACDEMFFGLSFATKSAFVVGSHPQSRPWFRADSVTCSSTKGGSIFGLAHERMLDERLTTEGIEGTELREKKIGKAVLRSRIGMQKLQCPTSKKAPTAFFNDRRSRCVLCG